MTPRAAVLSGTAVLLGALAACSTGGSPSPAAPTTSKAAKPTAVTTFDPMAGPIEAAAQLPKSCSKILEDTDLTAAFGSPQVGDTSYGSYAPLPNIGRTGRVTCGFDIGIDAFGHPGPAGVTVSIITYNSAANAVHRVASDVNDTVAKGATAQPVLVNGHPATILVEPATPAPAASPTAPGTATATTGAQPPPSPAQPTPSASPTASGGNTELVMADGNRTFVITIPMSKVSGAAATTTLVNIIALVYQHTLPPAAPPTPSAPPAPPSASASPSASPKPSAT